MTFLRAMILTVLALAVMPWGAYAAGQRVAVAAQMQVMTKADSGGPNVSVSRPCHGPALPGTPCHPDAALLPAGIEAPTGQHAIVVAIHDPLRPIGIVPAAIPDPPRLG